MSHPESGPERRPRGRRDGFALALALLVMVVVAGGALVALERMTTDRRVQDSHAAGEDAHALAENGLERFVQERESLGFSVTPPAPRESARIAMQGGYADVILEQVWAGTSDAEPRYVIRSRGVHTQGGWQDAPDARRTVARLAVWNDGTMDVQAGFQSLSGLQKNGGSGEFSGADRCFEDDDVAGVAVPQDPGYTQSGGQPIPDGDPPIDYTGSTKEEAAEQSPIDWNAIVNENAIPADITVPPEPFPHSSVFNDPDYWPTIYIDNPGGTYTLDTSGQGLLIVRGNVTIGGGIEWDGVIMVGGNLTSNGLDRVEGATITGLNLKLGEDVPASDVGNGVKYYRYDSCNVSRAMESLAGLVVYRNTWMDNWATY